MAMAKTRRWSSEASVCCGVSIDGHPIVPQPVVAFHRAPDAAFAGHLQDSRAGEEVDVPIDHGFGGVRDPGAQLGGGEPRPPLMACTIRSRTGWANSSKVSTMNDRIPCYRSQQMRTVDGGR